MRKPRRTEAHTLAGAYALDAITGADRARFERHLARCQACARELGEVREATAALAQAVATDPPAEVIERAVAAAARTRQLPPVTGPTRGWQAAGSRSPASRRVALGLAAVFLVGAAASGAAALTAEHHVGADQAREQAIAEVLNAPDAVMLTARVTGGGSATVVISRRDRALVFTTAGLPPLPASRCYQLWLMGPAGDRPADVLPAPDHGMTSPVIATGVAAGDWVGLTVGPADMSGHHPPAAPILMLNLT